MKNLLTFTFLLSLFACKHKEESIYAGCCGAEPTTSSVLVHTQDSLSGPFHDTIVLAHIFIPNIFMPSDDINALDNYFMVFGGEGVAEIESMHVTGENGESFFSVFSFYPNDPGAGWNGRKSDGTYYYGPINYEVKVKYIDGQSKTFTGKSCAFKCGDTDFPQDRLPDCYFSTQNNGNGQGDHGLPYNQSCFK